MFAKKLWLSARVTLDEVEDVIEQVDTVTERFLVNRMIFLAQVLVLLTCIALLTAGVIIDINITNNSNETVLSMWERLNWPYLTSIVFGPLVLALLWALNRYKLRRHERALSKLFADINIAHFEHKSAYWAVGDLCMFIELSMSSRGTGEMKE